MRVASHGNGSLMLAHLRRIELALLVLKPSLPLCDEAVQCVVVQIFLCQSRKRLGRRASSAAPAAVASAVAALPPPVAFDSL